MSKRITDGLSRLQNQSRIPATTWRHWCNLLDLDPVDAVDVWEGICHPIMVATRKVPEVPYILQMRAARLELDIFDFKEEIPKLLHITAFLYALKDETMTGGKAKSALLKFYRKSALQIPPDQPHGLFVQKFIVDLCAVGLVAKVLPAANITLANVLKPVVEGHGSIEQIIGLGLKVLAGKPYADKVRQCLEERENAANNPLPEPDELSAEDWRRTLRTTTSRMPGRRSMTMAMITARWRGIRSRSIWQDSKTPCTPFTRPKRRSNRKSAKKRTRR